LQKTIQQPPQSKGLATQVKPTDTPRITNLRVIKPASLSQQSMPTEKIEVIRGMTKFQESAE
jgi:hypothetical protein